MSSICTQLRTGAAIVLALGPLVTLTPPLTRDAVGIARDSSRAVNHGQAGYADSSPSKGVSAGLRQAVFARDFTGQSDSGQISSKTRPHATNQSVPPIVVSGIVEDSSTPGKKRPRILEAFEKAIESAPPPDHSDVQTYKLLSVEVEFGGYVGSTRTRVFVEVKNAPLPRR